MNMNFILRKIFEIHLNYRQKQVSRQYKKEGMSDKVLDEQRKINQKRHELDLPAKNNMQYKTFVQ